MTVRILVADDSRLSRRNIIRQLPSELHFEVTEAANGKEAIDLLRAAEFELLLLDLTMPEIDGIGVLDFLSQSASSPQVVVISADFQPEQQRTVMALGARKFIRKPLDQKEFEMTLFELGYL